MWPTWNALFAYLCLLIAAAAGAVVAFWRLRQILSPAIDNAVTSRSLDGALDPAFEPSSGCPRDS